MPFKLDDDGNFAKDEETGLPIWVNKQGVEAPYDPDEFGKKLSSANGESAARRKELAAAEAALATYREALGEEADPAEIKAQLAELEKLRKAAKAAEGSGDGSGKPGPEVAALQEQIDQLTTQLGGFEKKVADAEKAVQAKEAMIRDLTVSSRFRTSKWFNPQNGDAALTTLPPEAAEARFGRYFEVDENGRVVAKINGKTLWSEENSGEPASFDDVMPRILDADGEWTKRILNQKGATGSGAGSLPGGPGADRLSKSDLQNQAKLDAYIDKHGAEKYGEELKRLHAS